MSISCTDSLHVAGTMARGTVNAHLKSCGGPDLAGNFFKSKSFQNIYQGLFKRGFPQQQFISGEYVNLRMRRQAVLTFIPI